MSIMDRLATPFSLLVLAASLSTTGCATTEDDVDFGDDAAEIEEPEELGTATEELRVRNWDITTTSSGNRFTVSIRDTGRFPVDPISIETFFNRSGSLANTSSADAYIRFSRNGGDDALTHYKGLKANPMFFGSTPRTFQNPVGRSIWLTQAGEVKSALSTTTSACGRTLYHVMDKAIATLESSCSATLTQAAGGATASLEQNRRCADYVYATIAKVREAKAMCP
jgi:hypothetical protein